MLLETYSGSLQKALTRNSDQTSFRTLPIRTTEPGSVSNSDNSGPSDDGTFAVSSGGGATANNNICVYPYCRGEPGAEFWVRLWGWQNFGVNPNTLLWKKRMLAELMCVAGTQRGVDGKVIRENEYFASRVIVTRGSAYAVQDEIAWATVNLRACRRFQFDIAMGDELPAFGNALWAFTS
jgi:hypothetical protein